MDSFFLFLPSGRGFFSLDLATRGSLAGADGGATTLVATVGSTGSVAGGEAPGPGGASTTAGAGRPAYETGV